MQYSIKKFAEITGLTEHTLRYYEKENLLIPSRLTNGHRIYSEQDIEWVQFILRLKETGMPIKKIKNYAILRREGESTIVERKKILEEHQKYVNQMVKEWREHQNKLLQKIKFYDALCKK